MDNFNTNKRNIKAGKLSVKVTSIYLTEHKAGLRVETRRFSARLKPSSTVEIELLRGDGKLLLKTSYLKTTLESPTKNVIDSIVEEYIQYAKDHNMI